MSPNVTNEATKCHTSYLQAIVLKLVPCLQIRQPPKEVSTQDGDDNVTRDGAAPGQLREGQQQGCRRANITQLPPMNRFDFSFRQKL